MAGSRFATDASLYRPTISDPAIVAVSLTAWSFSLIITRWLWSVYGGFSLGSLNPSGLSRSFDTATVAPGVDTCVVTLNPRSSALFAGLLFGSDISFDTCAETFLSRCSFVGSRHASASRINKATFFHALAISLAPSLCTFSSAKRFRNGKNATLPEMTT
jgi:hypothetical protein